MSDTNPPFGNGHALEAWPGKHVTHCPTCGWFIAGIAWEPIDSNDSDAFSWLDSIESVPLYRRPWATVTLDPCGHHFLQPGDLPSAGPKVRLELPARHFAAVARDRLGGYVYSDCGKGVRAELFRAVLQSLGDGGAVDVSPRLAHAAVLAVLEHLPGARLPTRRYPMSRALVDAMVAERRQADADRGWGVHASVHPLPACPYCGRNTDEIIYDKDRHPTQSHHTARWHACGHEFDFPTLP